MIFIGFSFLFRFSALLNQVPVLPAPIRSIKSLSQYFALGTDGHAVCLLAGITRIIKQEENQRP